jgi:hypothetical protein
MVSRPDMIWSASPRGKDGIDPHALASAVSGLEALAGASRTWLARVGCAPGCAAGLEQPAAVSASTPATHPVIRQARPSLAMHALWRWPLQRQPNPGFRCLAREASATGRQMHVPMHVHLQS